VKPSFVSGGGVVASEHPYAALAGLRALEEGGNAVDAAVAVSFALAASQPALNGLGGDFMATVLTEGRVAFFNGTGWAPRGLTVELLRGLGLASVPRYGPLSIAVPGMVDGVHLMWRSLGSMEWARLISPAIGIARAGLPASPLLLEDLESIGAGGYGDGNTERIYSAARWGRVALGGLADVLEGIAEHGPEFFYREVGADLARYVSSIGGVLEPGDLSGYRAEASEPLSVDYRGYTIHESPPNSQGVTTLIILRELERSSPDPRSMIEAYGRAYSLRDAYVADPRFVEVPVDELLGTGGNGPAHGPGGGAEDTTNFVVVDSRGRVVSGVQSIYHRFGSRVTEPSHQVTLNNRASDFSLEGPNRLEPGKRPLHTLSSVIITRDGEPFAALGTSGGHFRPQIHALLITNMIDRGMDVAEAVEAPRFIWDGGSVTAEEGSTVDGARIVRRSRGSGVAHAVQFRGRDRMAHADGRGEGLALGEIR